MFLRKLKKITCTVLCASMVLTSACTGFTGMVARVSAAGVNLLDNPSFSKDANGWFATTADTAKLEFINDGKGHDQDGGYVKVTERSDTWNSLAQTIKDKVKNKTKYVEVVKED